LLVTAATHAGFPLRVSIEGINGVGKTSAARATAAALGARGVLLDELTDQANDTLPGKVIATLSGNGDLFLRTGHPIVETLALLALQVRKTERLAGRDLTGVDVIIEDRGVDSVAVYQAAILCAEHPQQPAQELAHRILSDAQRWFGLPDATVLLIGDPALCAQRFADRLGRPLAPADGLLIDEIDRLYRAMAVDNPERYITVDVAGLSPQEAAEILGRTVNALLARHATHVLKGTAA
jgi:dTMP kinase